MACLFAGRFVSVDRWTQTFGLMNDMRFARNIFPPMAGASSVTGSMATKAAPPHRPPPARDVCKWIRRLPHSNSAADQSTARRKRLRRPVMNDCIGIPSANGSAFSDQKEKAHSLLGVFSSSGGAGGIPPRLLIVQQRIDVLGCTASLLECPMIYS
jgi:hypothetical protein